MGKCRRLPEDKLHLFVSYSKHDKSWFEHDSLVPRLAKALELEGAEFWYDRVFLHAGDPWKDHIESAIDRSQIALLLVSQHFLNSEFVCDVELPRIEKRVKKGKLVAIPILVGYCDWASLPFLSSTQMLPGDQTPLIEYAESPASLDRVQHEILVAIKERMRDLRQRSDREPSALQGRHEHADGNPSPSTQDEQHFSGDAGDSFALQIDWELGAYPTGKDSLVRCLLRLRAATEPPVERRREASHLVLVLDVSGSMDVPNKYPLLVAAIESLLGVIGDDTWLTLVLFSNGAHMACQALPGTQARNQVRRIIGAIDSWQGRFFMTNLCQGLRLSIDAVRTFRVDHESVVPRIYVLTDGILSDASACHALVPELERLNIEVNSFGFGDDFDFDSIRRVVSSCRGGTIKHIRNTRDIVDRFCRVAQVAAAIFAQEVQIELEFAPQVIPGDFFQHRPKVFHWSASSFRPPMKPRFDVGVVEAGREYVWALEARLPKGVGPGFHLAQGHISYERVGKKEAMTHPIVVPVATGADGVERYEYVAQVFTELEGLRDNSPATQIAAYEARIRIAELEERDPAHLKSLQHVLDELKDGTMKEEIDPDIVRFADVDFGSQFIVEEGP